jgi:hypothetical protein
VDLLYGLVASVRHECHEACQFDRMCDRALVLVAKLVAAGGSNAEFRRHKLAEHSRVLIVQVIDVVLAKIAIHRISRD